jgi:hypothetical protein
VASNGRSPRQEGIVRFRFGLLSGRAFHGTPVGSLPDLASAPGGFNALTSQWAETDLGLEVFVTTSDLDSPTSQWNYSCAWDAVGKLSTRNCAPIGPFWLADQRKHHRRDRRRRSGRNAPRAKQPSRSRLTGFAAFAGTAAEYDPLPLARRDDPVRPDHLPAATPPPPQPLARPVSPDRGHRLFPSA